ncbi:hypothetical protein pb186bvf_002479 [Paramecium bursaria]
MYIQKLSPVLVFALIAMALTLKVSERNMAKVQTELAKSTYGSALLHLLELHALAGGAVQELVDAIEELVNDLEVAIEQLDFNFQQRTNEHNSLVLGYQQDAQDATIDINRTQDTLDNLLFPRKEQLSNKIAQIQEYQEDNRKNREEAILVRGQEQEEFELQVTEYNEATASVDEALALLQTLTNPSLIQIKRFQNSLKNLESKIRSRSKIAPMIKALITLASNQNFSDQGIIGSIVDALNDFRNAVVQALNDLTAQEAQNVLDHEEYLEQLDSEYAEFQRQINDTNINLTAVIAEGLLELENNTFAEETDTYQNLGNEYQRELGVSEQALALVQSVDFSAIKV